MAKILPFATDRAERKPGVRQAAGELVIFPGIRVEYHDNPPEPQAKRSRRRSRRRAEKTDALSA